MREEGVLSLHFDYQIRTPSAPYAVPRDRNGQWGAKEARTWPLGSPGLMGEVIHLHAWIHCTRKSIQPDREKKQEQMTAG